MPVAPRPRSSRPLPVLLASGALALLAAGALAGCTGSGDAAPSTAASATATSGATDESASDPTDAASPTPTGGAGALTATPLAVDCSVLAPDATIAIYSGMTPVGEPEAPAETDAAVIGAYKGTVCQWAADGSTMTLAVGRFDDDSLTRLKNSLVRTSNAVPTFDGEGYFSLVDTTGTAEAFTGSYWIVAISDTAAFSEPGGAEPLVDAAITALKARG